jgi:prepilin-type N-terminal cleavage/methylation domain-containing protein
MTKGLTLVEMLVVVGIIAVLLPVGIFSLVNHREGIAWRTQVAELSGLLRTGGQIARTSSRPVELVLADQRVYLVQDGVALHQQAGRVTAPHLEVHLTGHLQAGTRTGGVLLTWLPSGRVEGERNLRLTRGQRLQDFYLSSWGELDLEVGQ